jgi:hypothetical protein
MCKSLSHPQSPPEPIPRQPNPDQLAPMAHQRHRVCYVFHDPRTIVPSRMRSGVARQNPAPCLELVLEEPEGCHADAVIDIGFSK